MMKSLFSTGLAVALVSQALAQQTLREAHIGYVYPAGGRQGPRSRR
jgi:hypothetical protein